MDFDMFRREAEQCDRVQDVLIAFSSHGGAGSGMGPLLWNRLDTDFPKSETMRLAVMPSSYKEGSEVVSTYNTLFSLQEILYPNSGMTSLVNNDRIGDMLKKRQLNG